MTESVYHTGYDIELDLSRDDLGHPDRPSLWDEIYRPERFHHGLLRCTGANRDGTQCYEAMYVQVRRGKRVACHVNSAIGPHPSGAGPRRKALKERIAVSAQRAGFEAVLEDGSVRHTDVLVKGRGGSTIGWEVQFHRVTAESVRRRSRHARRRGITPMWTVEDPGSEAVDRAPWTRLDRVTDWRLIAGKQLNVRGGVRELRMERCDERRATPCPERGYGRCGGWHACWDLTRGMYLDDLIARTAGGEYVPLFLPTKTRRGGNYMWVTTRDKADFLQDRPEPTPWDGDVSDLDFGPDGDGDDGRIDAGAWLTATAAAGPGGIVVADRYLPPQDLVDLRNAFLRAERRCAAISDEAPPPLAIARGIAAIGEELRRRSDEARAERGRVLEQLYRHPWWDSVDNRVIAERELWKVARDQFSG
ncbi:MAG: hypothetical protein JF587_03260 [Catenulisporales bacterium]|nr:hypothetical protein [Catenulisporales bacterium]